MNKPRRKQLEAIIDRIDAIVADLEWVRDDEEEYRDNIPENLQGSERYERADTAVYSLEDALDTLSMVIDSINEAIEQ